MGHEQVRIDPVHHRAQPIGAWNTVVEFGKTAQKRQMCVSQIDDVLIIVAVRDRPAHHEQNLAKRIGHFPGLPRIFDLRKVVEHQPQPRLAENVDKSSIRPSRIDWAPRESVQHAADQNLSYRQREKRVKPDLGALWMAAGRIDRQHRIVVEGSADAPGKIRYSPSWHRLVGIKCNLIN